MKKNLLFLLVIISVSVSAQRFKTLTKSDTIDYSKVKFQALKYMTEYNYSSFSIFDSTALKSNVFFIGENHEYRKANTQLQISFIKYLQKKTGLRHIVMEFGFSRGWLVNNYINSVDSSYSEILKLYSYPEYFNYYRELRNFNLSLPDSARLSVYGIDIERFHDTPFKALSLLLPKTTPPDSIALSIESLQGIAAAIDAFLKENKLKKTDSDNDRGFVNFNYRLYSSEKTANSLVDDFLIHEKYYDEYLGDSCFLLYKRIILQLKEEAVYRKFEKQPQQYVLREQTMYKNILNYIAIHPNEKIFGQFGRCHIASEKQDSPCNWYDFKSLVSRLNSTNTPWLFGKVCSIAYFYNGDITFTKSIGENGFTKEILNYAADIDTIIAIKLNNDSAYFGEFSRYYNFIIYDSRALEISSEPKDIEVENDDISGNISINIGFQNLNQDFTSLNNYFVSQGFGPLSTNSTKLILGFQFNRIQRFSFNIYGFGLLNQNIKNTLDTTNMEFSGGGFMMDFGISVLPSKVIFLKPLIGFGLSSYSILLNQSDAKQKPRLDLFSNNHIEKFSLLNFVIDPGLELIIKLKFIGIGLKTGYQWSPKSYWYNIDRKKIGQSPELQSSGFYIQGNWYFMFDTY